MIWRDFLYYPESKCQYEKVIMFSNPSLFKHSHKQEEKKSLDEDKLDPVSQLLTASLDGNLEVVKQLREHIKRDIRNCANNTPLHLAIMEGHIEIIQYLIENGADIHAIGCGGNTPFAEACLKVPPRKTASPELALCKFQTILDIFIRHGFKLNSTDGLKNGELGDLAFAGALEAIKILHKRGVDLNLVDKFGCTPLHRVAEEGHYYDEQIDVVFYLLANGADWKIKNKQGKTPADVASEHYGNKTIYTLLQIKDKKYRELSKALESSASSFKKY